MEEYLKKVENSDYWLVDDEYIRELRYNDDGSMDTYTHELKKFAKENKAHPILDIINQYKTI